MRVLFACTVAVHPFLSMVPLARALLKDGHEVAFATGPEFSIFVRRLGFSTFPCGIDGEEFFVRLGELFPQWPVPPEESLRFYLSEECARLTAPAMLADLLPVVQRWGANLVVQDPSSFAGPIAARHHGIPSATHSWGPMFPMEEQHHASEAVAPLWAGGGLVPEPFGGTLAHLYLDICPPALQIPEAMQLSVRRMLRPTPIHVPLDDKGVMTLPTGWLADRSRPTIYVTLGTIFNRTSVLQAIVEGLRDEPVNLVVAVGRNIDPADFGPQPETVYIARYIAQPEILARSDMVVCHGGPGTVLAALAQGLPILALPQGLDQFESARQCVQAGVGRSLLPKEVKPETVIRDVRALLDRGEYRIRAEEVSAEISAMPSPDQGVRLLEELVSNPPP